MEEYRANVYLLPRRLFRRIDREPPPQVGGSCHMVRLRHGSPSASLPGIWSYLFLAAASHGLLDARTDGGLGVAFFSPFHQDRYFLPWRPIRVSSMGVSRFFTGRGLAALPSELLPGFGFPRRLSRPRFGCGGDARQKLSSRGQAAHEFLFAGQQVAQPRARGVGLNAALHFGKFLLGLALLERFDAA